MISASPVVHHTKGSQKVRAILGPVAIAGNFDRPGGVAVPLPPALLGHPVFTWRAELWGALAPSGRTCEISPPGRS